MIYHDGLCWGCGRNPRRRHPPWCPATAAERSHPQQELERLIHRQKKEMRLRHHYQPPEWDADGRPVFSYDATLPGATDVTWLEYHEELEQVVKIA